MPVAINFHGMEVEGNRVVFIGSARTARDRAGEVLAAVRVFVECNFSPRWGSTASTSLPRLAPWAAFLRRSAGGNGGICFTVLANIRRAFIHSRSRDSGAGTGS